MIPSDNKQSEQLQHDIQLEFSLSDALAISTPARPRRPAHQHQPNYEDPSTSDSADDYDPNMSAVEQSMHFDGLTLDSPRDAELDDDGEPEPIVLDSGLAMI